MEQAINVLRGTSNMFRTWAQKALQEDSSILLYPAVTVVVTVTVT